MARNDNLLNIIRRPHTKSEYTEQSIVELMQCIDDPLFFMRNFMRARHPIRGAVPFIPYPYQIDLVKAYQQHRFNIVMAARQLGKALDVRTPIPTPTGWTTMGEIGVGDTIFDGDGRPTTVTFATEVMHDHECFEVEFDHGEVIIADADHLWTVEYHSQSRTLTTRDLGMVVARLKGSQGVRIKTSGGLELPTVDLSIPPYYYIKDVIPTDSTPVRCIQVNSESHLFLCGKSMIPTHNTEVTVGYILWKAMFTPDSLILVTANKFTQALEIMDRIRYAYENMPSHIKAGVEDYNKSAISFDNGSRIMAQTTTPSTGRGLPLSLLYVDEFAAVPPKMAKAFWTAIRPTLATGGSCIITSTPQNDEDQFAEIWKGALDNLDKFGNPLEDGVGSNKFFASLYQWYHHPERNELWAETERASLGDAKFRQEYNCCVSETTVNLQSEPNDSVSMTMGDLFNLLNSGDK